MKPVQKVFSLFSLYLMLSCTSQVDIKVDLPSPSAVMHAMVSTDSVQKVSISRTTNGVGNSAEGSGKIPAGLYINDAGVELFINENRLGSMTRTDQDGEYIMPGCYPSVGDKVRFEVTTGEYEPLSAEVYVPRRPEIIKADTMMVNYGSGPVANPPVMDLRISFRDRADEVNYYKLTLVGHVTVEGDSITSREYPLRVSHDEELLLEDLYENYYPGYTTNTSYIFSDNLINGKEYTLKMQLHFMSRSYYSDTLSITNSCRIYLSEISGSLYLYYRSKILQRKQEEDALGSIGLREPVPTYTNIRNGYGLLSAKETAVHEIKINPGDTVPVSWYGDWGYGYGGEGYYGNEYNQP